MATLARLDHQASLRDGSQEAGAAAGAAKTVAESVVIRPLTFDFDQAGATAVSRGPEVLAKPTPAEARGGGRSSHNAHFLDDEAQLRLLQAVAVSDTVSAAEVEILHAAVIQCTAWGEINILMTDRLARLTRKVEDGSCNGAELVSWKLAELLVMQLQDQSWTEEALKVKLTTLVTMRALVLKVSCTPPCRRPLCALLVAPPPMASDGHLAEWCCH